VALPAEWTFPGARHLSSNDAWCLRPQTLTSHVEIRQISRHGAVERWSEVRREQHRDVDIQIRRLTAGK